MVPGYQPALHLGGPLPDRHRAGDPVPAAGPGAAAAREPPARPNAPPLIVPPLPKLISAPDARLTFGLLGLMSQLFELFAQFLHAPDRLALRIPLGVLGVGLGA